MGCERTSRKCVPIQLFCLRSPVCLNSASPYSTSFSWLRSRSLTELQCVCRGREAGRRRRVCVVCVVCACLFVFVCGVCVARPGTRKNPPCAGSARLRVYILQRLRVYQQHAQMFKHMWACCRYTRRRAEPAQGGRDREETQKKSRHVHQRFSANNKWVLPMNNLSKLKMGTKKIGLTHLESWYRQTKNGAFWGSERNDSLHSCSAWPQPWCYNQSNPVFFEKDTVEL